MNQFLLYDKKYRLPELKNQLKKINDFIKSKGGEIKKEGAKLTIDLKVSAPFHCKLMQDAAREMEKELKKISFFDSNIPIVFNADALSFYKNRNFPVLLSKQIINTVKWRETILFLDKSATIPKESLDKDFDNLVIFSELVPV